MFDYSIDGDLRFISHHDTLRLFQRAISRAEIPVRYSQGFNPQPKMSIPLPRPVGIASDAESIVIETAQPVDPDDALQRLNNHTPENLVLRCVRQLNTGEKPQPDQVRYRFEPGDALPDDIEQQIECLLRSDVVHVDRMNPKDKISKKVDIRPYLLALSMANHLIEFTLLVTGQGSAKPAEIAGLLGFNPQTINHQLRRMEVRWR